MSIPFRWRLAIALVGLSMSLVAIFVLIAKQTFEADKIPSVFAARQAELDVLAKQLSLKLEQGLNDAQSLLIGLDTKTQTLSPLAQNFFISERNLLGFEVSDLDEAKPIAEIVKAATLRETLKAPHPMPEHANFFSIALDNSRFLVMAKETINSRILIKAIVEIPDLLAMNDAHGTLILIDNGRVVARNKDFQLPKKIMDELSADRFERTMDRTIDEEKYLISAIGVPSSNMKLISVDSESYALSATHALYQRALLFIAFAGFLTILIAFALSTGLTRKLTSLTLIADKIGQGDFSQHPTATSRDEIGILQTAFSRMSDEIQKLLVETKEKGRMEEELKTARLVQDRLFPKDAVFQLNGFRLAGRYETSTECGGDWWHYFQRGDELIVVVADATGHGTPAALSTAASRSLFAYLEQDPNLDLKGIATAWDHSIAASSGQKVFMTAFIVSINSKTGEGHYLSASHEAPIFMKPGAGAEFLSLKASPPLGDLKGNWAQGSFAMERGERLFLFTDGLWAVESPSKKTISEARFAKALAKLSDVQKSPEALLNAINLSIQDHRQGEPYPDDVTLVVIDRLKP